MAQIIVEEVHLEQRTGKFGRFLNLRVTTDGTKYEVKKGNITHLRDIEKEQISKGSVLIGTAAKNGVYDHFLVDSIVNPEHKVSSDNIKDRVIEVRNKLQDALDILETMK